MSICTHCTSELSFVCLVGNEGKVSISYDLLERVKERFCSRYSSEQITSAVDHGLAFSNQLRLLIEEANKNPESDKAKEIVADLSYLTKTTAKNLGWSLLTL
eukprot:TRINITY_DN1108_c0_g1_i10.p2 TRINITY_DN1108_c0_g1~~TRINITY_DN1108_c0_g1_i10.p2  ORF type:complete len:102 (+),score=13.73 TRINITY_DN1108_c0_g1_i10:351-656(+)